MNMNKIDSYNVYQQNSYDNIMKNKLNNEAVAKAQAEKAGKTDKTNKTESAYANLSDGAKALLEELKEKYSNMDFMVASYSSEEEAQSILSRGTKEFSVLIEPELLEKMAADEATKEKYLGIIDEATGNIKDIRQQLSEDESAEVKRIGISVDADGNVSYFASLEKMNERQRERIEKSREEKKEAEAEAAKKEEEAKKSEKTDNPYRGPHKSITLKAGTADELLEMIRNLNWDEVKAEEKMNAGMRFDFTV
ncbi:MAG: hypothetical protein IJV71_06550 [Lachnospiraceae bacterium]|nr:hypothetical protein [Lachnospiraceae bacterium]